MAPPPRVACSTLPPRDAATARSQIDVTTTRVVYALVLFCENAGEISRVAPPAALARSGASSQAKPGQAMVPGGWSRAEPSRAEPFPVALPARWGALRSRTGCYRGPEIAPIASVFAAHIISIGPRHRLAASAGWEKYFQDAHENNNVSRAVFTLTCTAFTVRVARRNGAGRPPRCRRRRASSGLDNALGGRPLPPPMCVCPPSGAGRGGSPQRHPAASPGSHAARHAASRRKSCTHMMTYLSSPRGLGVVRQRYSDTNFFLFVFGPF